MKFFIIYFLSVNFVKYLLKKNLTAENCVRVPRTFVACFQAFAKVLRDCRYLFDSLGILVGSLAV